MGNTTSKPDINWHQQNKHIKDTKGHEMAVKAGETPSVFPDKETVERLVKDTWATGRPIGGTTKKVKDYSPLVVGHTHDGQEEHKVIVSYKPSKNFIHGWPAGRKSQPQ